MAAAPQGLPVLPPPDSLQQRAREIWIELAPHAARERTLTVSMTHAFRKLCEALAMYERAAAAIDLEGLVVTTALGETKAHPLLTHQRGWMQRIEAGLTRFRLSPMGKEVVPADAPKDEWADFDDGDPPTQH